MRQRATRVLLFFGIEAMESVVRVAGVRSLEKHIAQIVGGPPAFLKAKRGAQGLARKSNPPPSSPKM